MPVSREADAYRQLTLLDWTPEQISQVTAKPAERIRQALTLVFLPQQVRQAVAAQRARELAERQACLQALQVAATVRQDLLATSYGTVRGAKRLQLDASRAAVIDPAAITVSDRSHLLLTRLAGCGPEAAETAGTDRLTRFLVARWLTAAEASLERLTAGHWQASAAARLAYLDRFTAGGYVLCVAGTRLRATLTEQVGRRRRSAWLCAWASARSSKPDPGPARSPGGAVQGQPGRRGVGVVLTTDRQARRALRRQPSHNVALTRQVLRCRGESRGHVGDQLPGLHGVVLLSPSQHWSGVRTLPLLIIVIGKANETAPGPGGVGDDLESMCPSTGVLARQNQRVEDIDRGSHCWEAMTCGRPRQLRISRPGPVTN